MKERLRWTLLATILACVALPLSSEEILMQTASTPATASFTVVDQQLDHQTAKGTASKVRHPTTGAD